MATSAPRAVAAWVSEQPGSRQVDHVNRQSPRRGT